MKRIILIIFLIIFAAIPVYSHDLQNSQKQEKKPVVQIRETVKLNGQVQYDDAEVETIYLEEDIEKPTVDIPSKTLTLPADVLNITSNANTYRSALARSMVNRDRLTYIMPLYASVTETYHGFSYGQTWGQEISRSQIEENTSFFLRYDTPKWFSLAAFIKQSANQDIGTQYNILKISPELHITDRLTIKNAFSTYMNLPKNKSEITLVYTPSLSKYADALKFELGFAESYYRNGQRSSAVSFSTGFKL